MKRNKGFSIIELMIVISLLNILATIAVTSYADYTKKARIAEAPLMLKALVLRIDEYMGDAPPKSNGKCELVGSNGRCQDNFPKNADDIGFRTNRGSVFGSFFEFKVKSPIPKGCDQNNLDKFAYAVPIIKTSVPDDYQFMCMNERFDLFHGSKSSDNGGGNAGGNGGGNAGGNGGGNAGGNGGGAGGNGGGKDNGNNAGGKDNGNNAGGNGGGKKN
jgi:prepilin-type N-terminal cleavage/methylation domain-containing protein